ncbi:hypothetical protein L0Y46_01550 [bacterium]|nr:hypothetical protein [bacterium]
MEGHKETFNKKETIGLFVLLFLVGGFVFAFFSGSEESGGITKVQKNSVSSISDNKDVSSGFAASAWEEARKMASGTASEEFEETSAAPVVENEDPVILIDSDDPEKTEEELETYENKKHGFSFRHPASWNIEEKSDKKGDGLIMYSGGAPDIKLKTMLVFVVTQDISEPGDLKSQLESRMNLVSHKTQTIGGVSWQLYTYTFPESLDTYIFYTFSRYGNYFYITGGKNTANKLFIDTLIETFSFEAF